MGCPSCPAPRERRNRYRSEMFVHPLCEASMKECGDGRDSGREREETRDSRRATQERPAPSEHSGLGKTTCLTNRGQSAPGSSCACRIRPATVLVERDQRKKAMIGLSFTSSRAEAGTGIGTGLRCCCIMSSGRRGPVRGQGRRKAHLLERTDRVERDARSSTAATSEASAPIHRT